MKKAIALFRMQYEEGQPVLSADAFSYPDIMVSFDSEDENAREHAIRRMSQIRNAEVLKDEIRNESEGPEMRSTRDRRYEIIELDILVV